MKKEATNASILVVDDSEATIEIIRRNLKDAGYRVFAASSVPEALRTLEDMRLDLVVTDLKMPKVSGMDLVKHVRQNCPDVEVMMITGYATVEGAVEAVKSGAEQFLAKPFTEEELLLAVGRALDKLQMRRAATKENRPPGEDLHGLIGESLGMQKVREAITRTSATSATVLIYGESGTGKELVARAIHYSSRRAAATFVPVNCGSIPEGLLESELFGHVKGAYSGASETRAGFFQTADGGSIFFDEVGETSLAMQVKLLRVLEDREVCMVGSTKPRKVDVRILAATNKDLFRLVEKGSFREDLYYRLNVINIVVPPLRERGKDILLLARHFLEKHSEDAQRKPPALSDEVLTALRGYPWPGNVRELENLIQRLVVMVPGPRIEIADLPSLMRFSAGAAPDTLRTLAEVEAEHIRNVLASVDANKTRAAEILGIDRKTLREKLKRGEPGEA